MTKAERDHLRAKMAMRLLERIAPRAHAEDYMGNRSTNVQHCLRAEWVVSEANALIAELSMYEEAEAVLFPNGEEPENVFGMTDAQLLAKFPLDNSHRKCAHQISISEPCAECEKGEAEGMGGDAVLNRGIT
jgi:hypothetical protein